MASHLNGVNCFEGRNYYKDRKIVCFSATFDDGLILIYEYDSDTSTINYMYMVSVGLDSVYLKNYKPPGKSSMDRRKKLVEDWVLKNKNRYKLLKSS